MFDALKIINHFQLILFVHIFLLAALYTLTIIVTPRFRHTNNFLTVNLCIGAILASIYWIYFYVSWLYYPENFLTPYTCFVFNYFEMMTTIQIPLAAIVVSIYRLCRVAHHQKRIFRKKTFITICVISQWLVAILVPIPRYQLLGPVSML